jgi:hypothetical protein
MRTFQVPLLIFIGSLTLKTPVRDKSDFTPDFLFIRPICCLLGKLNHLLSREKILYGVSSRSPFNFGSPITLSTLRRFRYLRRRKTRYMVESVSFHNRTFTCEINKASLLLKQHQVPTWRTIY